MGNQLYKVNTTNGSLISNTPLATAGNIVTLPYQWRSFVYFGTDLGQLYALNASDPTVSRANWPVNIIGGRFEGSPYMELFLTVIIDTVGNTLYATSATTGTGAAGRVYRFNLE